MPSSVLGQKETDPRGLRGSAGSRKVPDSKSKKRRLSSPLRTTLVLLLRGLLRLLLCWHQWITSSWPLIDGYIDTLTSLMSTELTGKSSSGRRRNLGPRSRIGGFAKGARLEIKKATTLVAAQDNLSASSSRTSSPSSLLASVDHLLLATH